MRTELGQLIYCQALAPKNLYLESEPLRHDENRKRIIAPQIDRMVENGTWKKSIYDE